VLDERDAVHRGLSLRVIWRIALYICTLQLGEYVAVFAKALEKVELLGKYLLEDV
jgi:hypothetical protein